MDRPFVGKRACFFAKVEDKAVLKRNQFYEVDIRILERLGFQVEICTNPFRIPKADVYFVWWWTWAFMPLLRARFARSPVVIVGPFDHVMPDGTLQFYPQRPALHRALIRWSLRQADANVVCAEDQRLLMAGLFEVRNLQVSPHVVDTDLYHPVSGPKDPYFITVCWMQKDNAIRKCVATSVLAMAAVRDRLPGYRLVVVGEKGEGYPPLAALVEELNLEDRVDFLGVVSTEEKIRLMQHATAYLQPSLAEGFGVATLEALSCGTPAIASLVGGVPEVVGDCTLSVDGRDAVGLAEAMHRIATNHPLAQDLRARGRDRAVRLFSFRRRYTDLRRILGEVLA